MKSPHNKSNQNHLSVATNNEASYSYENSAFLPVNSIWICRHQYIIAESQIGSKSINKKQKRFVKVFLEQIIQPSKHSNSSKKLATSPSFTIYVKKRKYLFHILLHADLTFLSLTTNTLQQEPLQEIFDLLYAVKSAFLYEDGLTFNDTLTDLHHSYQFKSKSKIIYFKDNNNNKSLLSHSDDLHNFDLCDSDGFDTLFSGHSSGKPSNDTLHTIDTHTNTFNLCSPSPSNGNNISSASGSAASPTFSVNSTHTFSDTHTRTNSSKSKSNKSSETNTTFKINYEQKECEDSMEIEEVEQVEYFILKKGWMSKLGDRFKTWKFRYFELWSNGLLNYFDNEMKIKKKGALNIMDEVINVELYSKNDKNGFILTTHDRACSFVVNKENVRNDWYLLIQTIIYNKNVDLNVKFKSLKLRLEKLEFKWETKFKNIEFDIISGVGNEQNIYQLQYELHCASSLCEKCKKEVVYFCGSDIFPVFTSKIDYICTNIEGTLSSIDAIIHSRNETPFRKRKRNRNKWYTKRHRNRNSNQKLKQNISNTSSNSNSNSNTSSSFEEHKIVMRGRIKIRLPSKKFIRAKNALSKKIKALNVQVQEKCFRIDVTRENTAPLVWRFDEILGINDIKGVYYGKRKTDKINIHDIQQFQITLYHSSNRRLQFLFNNENDAYLWYSTLKSLYDKANVVHVPLNYKQIGL